MQKHICQCKLGGPLIMNHRARSDATKVWIFNDFEVLQFTTFTIFSILKYM